MSKRSEASSELVVERGEAGAGTLENLRRFLVRALRFYNYAVPAIVLGLSVVLLGVGAW